MIFLSASIPDFTDDFVAYRSKVAIRRATIAFASVCAKYNIGFYCGGHPAILSIINSVLEDYPHYKNTKVKLYQSKYFENNISEDVKSFKHIEWTAAKSDRDKSLKELREKMFSDHNPTQCEIVIGGKKGVAEETEDIKKRNPGIKVYPIASTGGTALELFLKENYANVKLLTASAYDKLFYDLLKEFIEEGLSDAQFKTGEC